MAATNIIATGSTAANSGDVAIAAGTTVGLKGLIPGASDALVRIELKDDGAAYNQVGLLTPGQPVLVINGAGTYKFTRAAGGTCGVYSA